ncbi:hypothetical protein SJI19_16885 [Acerihabitans sp. TG2]|uniref:hypothetical protein n=1 Tax=Acerihabitans sp. TG2 TaxID=3096008 RepID=UPI002B231DFD|nr:hypothetical protein [Acerihabitans sp. TG2]MEA9392202.1 hypothetical protein [Acerihabitans sp. TG2]
MAKLTKSQRVISIAIGLSLTSAGGAALYGFGPAEMWTQSQISQLVASANSDIASFTASFGSQLTTTFEQLISAVAVSTKQEALASSQISDTTMQAAQQLLNATTTQNTNDQVVKAVLDYSGSTGQGYQPCIVLYKNKSLDHAWDGLPQVVKTRMRRSEMYGGNLVASTNDAMQNRLKTHRDKFCTPSEEKAGLCTASSLPGGDTNAATLFESAAPDSIVDQARTSYIENVLGAPDQIITSKAGKSQSGQTYMLSKARKDAFLSIPAYSLNMIAQANTGSPDYDNKSPNEMLQMRVNQYFGGKEALQWAATLTRQQPRGLLVELAKMEGTNAWINQKQFEQNQRIIANLAAQELLMAEPLKANLDNKAMRMNSASAMQQVK